MELEETGMEFKLSGKSYALTRQQVEEAMRGIQPEPVRQHFVVIHQRDYPVKQVLTEVLRMAKLDFTTQQARSILKRLGFDVMER
jgi:hypothetical protein